MPIKYYIIVEILQIIRKYSNYQCNQDKYGSDINHQTIIRIVFYKWGSGDKHALLFKNELRDIVNEKSHTKLYSF